MCSRCQLPIFNKRLCTGHWRNDWLRIAYCSTALVSSTYLGVPWHSLACHLWVSVKVSVISNWVQHHLLKNCVGWSWAQSFVDVFLQSSSARNSDWPVSWHIECLMVFTYWQEHWFSCSILLKLLQNGLNFFVTLVCPHGEDLMCLLSKNGQKCLNYSWLPSWIVLDQVSLWCGPLNPTAPTM